MLAICSEKCKVICTSGRRKNNIATLRSTVGPGAPRRGLGRILRHVACGMLPKRRAGAGRAAIIRRTLSKNRA